MTTTEHTYFAYTYTIDQGGNKQDTADICDDGDFSGLPVSVAACVRDSIAHEYTGDTASEIDQIADLIETLTEADFDGPAAIQSYTSTGEPTAIIRYHSEADTFGAALTGAGLYIEIMRVEKTGT